MVKFTVVSGNASTDLAKRIARKLKSPYIKTEKKVFPDGESKITINQIPKKSIVVVVQSTYPPVYLQIWGVKKEQRNLQIF